MEIGCKLQLGAPQGFRSRLNEIHLLLRFCSAIKAALAKPCQLRGNVNRLTDNLTESTAADCDRQVIICQHGRLMFPLPCQHMTGSQGLVRMKLVHLCRTCGFSHGRLCFQLYHSRQHAYDDWVIEAFQTSLKHAVTELALNNFLCGNQRNLQQPWGSFLFCFNGAI